MMPPVAFKVLGDPMTQAGTKSVPITLPNGKRIWRKVTEGGVTLKSWRQEVSSEAAIAAEKFGMFTGPVHLQVLFRLEMPKSRPGWARQQGVLLAAKKPDLDKLVRAIGDSLKVGGLIKDDGLIAVTTSAKVEVWEQWLGCAVRITALDQAAFDLTMVTG